MTTERRRQDRHYYFGPEILETPGARKGISSSSDRQLRPKHSKRTLRSARSRPRLLTAAGTDIRIWLRSYRAMLNVSPVGWPSSSSAQELTRFRRLRCPESRLQFAMGRHLARGALSAMMAVPPDAWKFTVGEHGRPEVAWPRNCKPPTFSISHTSGLVAVAVGNHSQMGLDVEKVDRDFEFADVAEAVFTQAELKWMSQGGADGARSRFYDLWCLKEAYMKARGLGFSLAPNSFEIAVRDGSIELQRGPDCDPDPGRWQFCLLRPAPDMAMAIAIGSRSAVRVRLHGTRSSSGSRCKRLR